MKFVRLVKSPLPEKKLRVYLQDGEKEHHVDFGAKGYSDFTKHKEEARKQLYIQRHAAREDWTKSGILTPGFWSRWVLWNKPTIEGSLADTKRRFDL